MWICPRMIVAASTLLWTACTPSRAMLLEELRSTNATLAKLAAQLNEQQAVLDEQASQLALLRKEVSKPPAPSAPPPEPSSPEDDPHIHCPSTAVCVIDQARWDELVDDPSALARQCRLIPMQENGRTRGFKLFGIRRGSVPHALGFTNGDMITHINDIRVETVDGFMELAAGVRHARSFLLTFERRGESMSRLVKIR